MQTLFELSNKCIRTIDCHLANVFLENLGHLSHPIFALLTFNLQMLAGKSFATFCRINRVMPTNTDKTLHRFK